MTELGESRFEKKKVTRQKILLTGGTGFAGRYAVKRLIEDGYSVYALVRDKDRLQKVLGKDFQQGLLNVIQLENSEKTPISKLKQLIEEHEITTIIHAAGIVGEHKIPWDQYFDVNVAWTKNLALAFLEANVNHDLFIFTSSVGVYGTIPKHVPADEDTPYNPDGKYHKSKVMAEKELLELQSSSNLPLIILRPTILYGNGDRGFLLKLFKLMEKKRFPLCTGNPSIHLLDVELLADVYAQLVSVNPRPTRCIFNVGDVGPTRIRELAGYIAKCMDAGYLKVPSFVFSLLIKLVRFNSQYSVSLKLISRSWFYNVDRLYGTFNFKAPDTIDSLDKKYIEWYKGAGDVG
jgi:nucleoside-diphosphate-sugar epimerase